MKIAVYNLTTTTKTGGIESFTWGIAGGLAERGHDVDIFGGEGPIRCPVPEGVGVLTYPFIERGRFPNFGSRFRKFLERLSFAFYAYKDLTGNGYDIIYVHKPFDIPPALLAARRTGAKVVFGSGGTEFFPGYRWLVKRLDGFFSCSEFNASEIEAHAGVRPRVLYNGIDTDHFRPGEPDARLMASLGIAPGQKVVVTACRLVGWKGVRHAIDAVGMLAGKMDVKYMVMGAGEERPELERRAREAGLGGTVVFLGPVPNRDLPRYYSIAQAAVFPSVANETFGISIAEAMACAVPVVSTEVGGIPEVVDAEGGILVPPGDPAAIAAALERILSDDGARETWGAKGRDRVVRLFSWEKVVDRFEGFIADA